MSTSILDDVKHTLGLLPEDTAHDSDVIMHINTAFSELTQIGAGPVAGYMITGKEDRWDAFFTDARLNSIKSYIFLKVKLIMDPPGTSFGIQAMERQLTEMQFRINVVADYG